MNPRLRTIAACHAEANRPYVEEPFRPVPLPVQITDETHPNIAAAIEWARKKKDAGNG